MTTPTRRNFFRSLTAAPLAVFLAPPAESGLGLLVTRPEPGLIHVEAVDSNKYIVSGGTKKQRDVVIGSALSAELELDGKVSFHDCLRIAAVFARYVG
mgnify:CR=1 FL=1